MIALKPSKIICVGRNYRAHAEELGNPMPPEPILFLKPPSALISDGETIVLPPLSSQVEMESEIGVVMLERARDISPETAERLPLAFTCVNDVTARDLQKRDGQWTRAKGFDTFCPSGPVVAVGLDWRALELIGRLNGQEVQRAGSGEMAFPIPFILSYISRVMTLEPGDLIATGTPAGTARLSRGDVVEVEIPGVGVLRNPVE
ncbi:MAG: fumarylacetoacetate hydrolase family protein [Gemmatimonadota bacterium]|nr:fumarylacetoacetate hydrolase family protein [Gemmatimonadota bacterium]